MGRDQKFNEQAGSGTIPAIPENANHKPYRESGHGSYVSWWNKYDKAWDHFHAHGSLDNFSEKQWMRNIRSSRKRGKLSQTKIEYLKLLNFDYAPSPVGSPGRAGKHIDVAKALVKRMNDESGLAHFTKEECEQLKKYLENYYKEFQEGRLSSKSAAILGVDNDKTYSPMMDAIANRLEELEINTDQPDGIEVL